MALDTIRLDLKNMAKILLIDDDEDYAALVAQALKSEKYLVEIAYDGEEGLHRLLSYPYDLVICDWAMPIKSGLEVVHEYRAKGGNTLILMLTGRTSVDAINQGLDSGADDYLGKPFHTGELLARVAALLRRSRQAEPSKVLRWADLELDLSTLAVTRSGSAIKLGRKEIELLTLFLKNPNRVFSVKQMAISWSESEDASEDTVRTTIKTLRKKLSAAGGPEIIVNIHGQGYRLNENSDVYEG
ncbi:response regulator transcription factor [soil metagenome]